MPLWKPFKWLDNEFDLSHLHPYTRTFEWAATAAAPARTFEVHVAFSCHCFTEKVLAGTALAGKPVFRDDRETRIFNFERHARSFVLPSLVDQLPTMPCYHTNHGNFFTIDRADETYEVYFEVTREPESKVLRLFVRTAFVRDQAHQGSAPRRDKIKFFVVLKNVQEGRLIKPAP